MEVEHFHDKDTYPDKVLDWRNLLPACKRCNGSKGKHDVIAEPIIDPTCSDPKDHFELRLYRFRGKSVLGSSTIGVVDLNNTQRAVYKRYKIGTAIQESVEDAWEKLDKFKSNGSTISKNKLLGHVEKLLLECQREAAYAATASTILHSDKTYQMLIVEMQNAGIWSEELERLHVASQEITLDYV